MGMAGLALFSDIWDLSDGSMDTVFYEHLLNSLKHFPSVIAFKSVQFLGLTASIMRSCDLFTSLSFIGGESDKWFSDPDIIKYRNAAFTTLQSGTIDTFAKMAQPKLQIMMYLSSQLKV